MSPLALPRLLAMAGGAVGLWELIAKDKSGLEKVVGEERAALWVDACRKTDPVQVLSSLAEKGIRVILPEDGALPQGVWSIYDPPALLFAQGREAGSGAPFVAVVGARKASSYGKRSAAFLACELARCGVVVVSGAAYGIDGHAHRGCLEAGGFTVAVLGCGIDRVYPPEHGPLFEHIKEQGCLLSEYAPGEDPLPWRFPHRNRIIAGLVQAVVVVEASEKSGALITAEFALEEGREVLAVPGPIDSPISRGTNALIQKGAKLVAGVEDVLEELRYFQPRYEPGTGGGEAGAQLSFAGDMHPRDKVLLALLRDGSQSLDRLVEMAGVSPGEILSRLASLALKGWVTQEPGGKYGMSRPL